MTFSRNQFEEMHTRLEEIERREQQLLSALREKLTETDQRLLNEVRNVSTEHEARRSVILTELQALAENIGAFPMASDPVEAIDYDAVDLPLYIPDEEPEEPEAPEVPGAGTMPPHGADWRLAAEKIRDDLEAGMNGTRMFS